MRNPHYLDHSYEAKLSRKIRQWRWSQLHIDPLLLIGITLLCSMGLIILYSASNEHIHMVDQQILRYALSFGLMFTCAQIHPRYFRLVTPWLYGLGFFSLLLVLAIGHSSQGATRWIGFGRLLIQPAEIMKLALPSSKLVWLDLRDNQITDAGKNMFKNIRNSGGCFTKVQLSN